MLADEIIASDLLPRALGVDGHSILCKALTIAQRFDLSEDFSTAASQISMTNMASFQHAIAACRAPAPMCWFEVDARHRRNFTKDEKRAKSDPHWGEISRAGCLLEQVSDDGLCYVLTIGWSQRLRGAGVNMFSLMVDLRPGNPLARQIRNLTESERAAVKRGLSPNYSGADLDAATELETSTALFVGRHAEACLDMLAEKYPVGSKEHKAIASSEQDNWGGELLYWLSVIALINTRNVGSRQTVEHTTINKKRCKSGKLPLLDYTICKLNVCERSGGAAANDNGPNGRVRAHFVRGHFKLRRTGVFWWRPAVRGCASLGMKLKSYSVGGALTKAA